MRILMLGNSFTYYHNMPDVLSALTGWEVYANTRGGAYLSEQLDSNSDLGQKALALLTDEKWDYVIVQEQSNAPITKKQVFLESASKLCELIYKNGAFPVFYATWAYQEGSEKLSSLMMDYGTMDHSLYQSYHEAADKANAITADVGKAFTSVRKTINLYEQDSYHPTQAGSLLAAVTISETICEHIRKGK